MTKNKSWSVLVMVVCLFILGVLACVFPAEVVIDDGLFPSAIDEGYAKLDVAKAGCGCETSVVTGRVKYTDGQGLDKIHFTGKIDHILNPGCEVPEDTNLWATGTYNPGKGTFNIGLFGPNHADYDEEKCADCELCWRLWLEGGQFDGYQNWTCGLENEEALTVVEHPPDSACGSD